MNYAQWQEEQDFAATARYDRFAGYDRGDSGREAEIEAAELADLNEQWARELAEDEAAAAGK